MATHVDDLTIEYVEDDQVLVKELDKEILTKGAWATIMYKYQEWNNAKEEFGPVKFTIRRYQKRNDEYRQRSKFNISSVEQAAKIVETLSRWTA